MIDWREVKRSSEDGVKVVPPSSRCRWKVSRRTSSAALAAAWTSAGERSAKKYLELVENREDRDVFLRKIGAPEQIRLSEELECYSFRIASAQIDEVCFVATSGAFSTSNIISIYVDSGRRQFLLFAVATTLLGGLLVWALRT